MHESICSRFERKCNKERPGDGFMIYQKHFTIWQSSLAQISKCLLYGRRAGILLISATSPGKGCSGHVTTGNPPLWRIRNTAASIVQLLWKMESFGYVFGEQCTEAERVRAEFYRTDSSGRGCGAATAQKKKKKKEASLSSVRMLAWWWWWDRHFFNLKKHPISKNPEVDMFVCGAQETWCSQEIKSNLRRFCPLSKATSTRAVC